MRFTTSTRLLPVIAVIFVACTSAMHADGPDTLQHPSFRLAFAGVPDAIGAPVAGTRAETPLQPLLPAARSRRSPFLAGLMSLVLPGAGEVYSESYILAGIFLAAEVTGWMFANSNNNKGDNQTAYFQSYADQHWSAVKYAEWLNANAKSFPGGENTSTIEINPDAALSPWQRVNWAQLNAVEMAIPQFSHRLPAHGEQQYYELIGKYNQYSYGWEDKLDGSYYDISARFHYYAGQRGKANDFYNKASLFVNLVVMNHVLSAVDAAWAAARFNKDVELHSQVRVLTLPDGRADLMPSTRLSWSF